MSTPKIALSRRAVALPLDTGRRHFPAFAPALTVQPQQHWQRASFDAARWVNAQRIEASWGYLL